MVLDLVTLIVWFVPISDKKLFLIECAKIQKSLKPDPTQQFGVSSGLNRETWNFVKWNPPRPGLLQITMSVTPASVKKTQESLGKYVKKPPLTDKLLNKPPFRFLHDVISAVIRETGFFHGLYNEVENKSENVKGLSQLIFSRCDLYIFDYRSTHFLRPILIT